MEITQSNLTDILLVGQEKKPYALYVGWIPQQFLHSHSHLTNNSYRLAGEISLYEIEEGAIVCTIDTFAYRARHQTTTEVKRIKTGTFGDTRSDQRRPLKLSAVIIDKELFIIIVKAGPKVEDIAPMAPMRVSGMGALHNAIRQARRRKEEEFSSNETKEKAS